MNREGVKSYYEFRESFGLFQPYQLFQVFLTLWINPTDNTGVFTNANGRLSNMHDHNAFRLIQQDFRSS